MIRATARNYPSAMGAVHAACAAVGAGPVEVEARSARPSVGRFIEAIENDAVRVDCLALIGLMRALTGCAPILWGSSLVGFGAYPAPSEGESAECAEGPLLGFQPRPDGVSLHLPGGPEPYRMELSGLGHHESANGLVRLDSLDKVDSEALRALFMACIRYAQARYLPARAA